MEADALVKTIMVAYTIISVSQGHSYLLAAFQIFHAQFVDKHCRQSQTKLQTLQVALVSTKRCLCRIVRQCRLKLV